MPNRIIGHILYKATSLLSMVSTSIRNHKNFYLLKNIELPFNIEKQVELRTPNQIKLHKDCTIKARTIINGRSSKKEFGINFGENTYLKENCYFDAYGGFIEIKGFCAFGQNTIIHGGGGVEIGKNVITGSNCYLISSNHNYESKEFPIMLQGDKRKGIIIEDNVWLGGSVVVLDGVRIGRNSVIGAGTIVTKNVPKNSLLYNKNNIQIKEIYK